MKQFVAIYMMVARRQRHNHESRIISIVGNRNRATTSQECNRRIKYDVVALLLYVFISYKPSIHPIFNPNPVSSH
jgi:hypothetical protein